ncbi:MAG: hypothetical protein IJN49_02645 [Clostridia bacterium]|nr:hypothetical protein [Clostridia bacterium]
MIYYTRLAYYNKQTNSLLETHNVTFNWVKGHNEHPENERCDKLAVSEYQQYL